MSDLNQFSCTGRLGAEPEKKTFNSGDSIVNLRIAVSETWKKDGERQERTLWLPVTIQNQGVARVAESYLKKGSKVAVSGKLQSRSYEKDGQTVNIVELVIGPFNGSLTLLDGKSEGEQPQRQERRQEPRQNAGSFASSAMDDDIPFAPEFR